MAWSLSSGLLAWVLMGPGAAEAVPTEPAADGEGAVEAAEGVEASVPEPAEPALPEPNGPDPIDPDAAGAEPVESVPTDVATPPPTPMPPVPTVTPPAPDHVRIHPPKFRGTGLFIGAGVAFGLVALYQVGDVLLCGGCAIGIVERLGLVIGIASATGGGVVRAYHDSWYDTALRRERPAKRFIVAGAVLTGVGGALGLTNEALWWGCWIGGGGPYAYTVVDEWGPWTDCRHGAAQGLADGASALVASGGGLLGYGLTLRKRQRVFRRAKVIATVPSLGFGRSGLSLRLGGRF